MSHFLKSGILQATKQGLTATATIGSSKLNVRCNSKKYEQLFLELEGVLDSINA